VSVECAYAGEADHARHLELAQAGASASLAQSSPVSELAILS
jgi:hypothetical protein